MVSGPVASWDWLFSMVWLPFGRQCDKRHLGAEVPVAEGEDKPRRRPQRISVRAGSQEAPQASGHGSATSAQWTEVGRAGDLGRVVGACNGP
jgi:hypothetical protein